MSRKATQVMRTGVGEIVGRQPPTVSIVILNYNGQRHLETCLASLAELNYPKDRLEINVVDNASTDDSVAWIKAEHPEIRLLVNSTNLGFAAGANRGAQIASGSCLAFLNSDMRVDEDWLLALVQTMNSEPNVVCAGSVVLNWTGDKIDYAGRPDDALNLCFRPQEDASTILGSVKDVPMLFASGGAMLVRRAVFQGLGGFDEDYFLYHEDVDLGWRLWLAGYQVLRSSRSLVFHRGGASSQQLSPENIMCQAQRNTLYTLLKNLGDDQLWYALPSVLWFLVNRSRWFSSSKLSLGQAIKELSQVIEIVWQKRLVTQSRRVQTDEAIFATCGHPLDFLSTFPGNVEFRRYLLNTDASLMLPVASASALSVHIIHLLYHAYKFNYEQLLEKSGEEEGAIQVLRAQRAENAQLIQQLNIIYSSKLWKLGTLYRRIFEGALMRLGLRRPRVYAAPTSPPPIAKATPKPVLELGISGKTDILCFPAIDWNFRFQRPQQLLTQFARNGHRVFYLRITFAGLEYTTVDVRPLAERVYELALPGEPVTIIYRDDLVDPTLNKASEALCAFIRTQGVAEAVCLVQHPFWVPLVQLLRERYGWKIVYDCMADLDAFKAMSKGIPKREDSLIAMSDLVVTSSPSFRERVQAADVNCVLVPNAADYSHFSQLPPRAESPLAHLPRPVIGYYGSIAEWFDLEAIRCAAERYPQWSFALIGHAFADLQNLSGLSNVHVFSEKPYEELPAYIAGMDVCAIPLRRTQVTEAMDSVKVFECLGAGKPVVARRLPELEPWADVVRLYETSEEFACQLELALNENSTDQIRLRHAIALENTWENRYAVLSSHVNALYDKASIIVVTWNNLELTRRCLDSILRDETWCSYELILVDNASNDGTVEYLKELAAQSPRVKIILNDKNLGFAGANNLGIREARDSKFVVLLNNDTIVPHGWLARLLRHARKPKVGMVGPVTNRIGNEARIPVAYLDLEEMEMFAQAYVGAQEGEVMDIDVLAMFCVAMRKAVVDQIGPLDERFGVGMFEDDDYARRVRNASYRVICAEDVFVHHEGNASFSQLSEFEYNSLFELNKRLYQEKWGEPWKPHQYRTPKSPR